MLNALNNPKDLKAAIGEYHSHQHENGRIKELRELLTQIQEDVESNSELLFKVAEDLEYSIEDQISNKTPDQLSIGFYHDCDTYIRTCALLKQKQEQSAEIIKQVVDYQLDYFDGITNEKFKPYHRDFIERLVVMLKTFNRLMPGDSEMLMLQSESELLLANYMRQYIESKVEKGNYSHELIGQIRELVQFSYEAAIQTGHNALNHTNEANHDYVFDLLDDCNAAYADWFLQIGDKKQALEVCDKHHRTNPHTNIHYDLNLRHPQEDKLRRKVRENDTRREREHDENKLFGLYIKTYSSYLDGDVVEGSRLLAILAETKPVFAREISRRFSGGQPALKTGDWADNLLDKLDSDPFWQ